MRSRVADLLPTFPWDTLAAAKVTAAAHPGGLVDLSVGTPVDPTPDFIADALCSAADSWAGYPTVWGTPALRASIIGYMTRRWNVAGLDEKGVLPVIGTKEVVASLPAQLGLGAGDLVVIPSTAYPTYEVGALLAGCEIQRCDDPDEVAGKPALIWINYPANPHGEIASLQLLQRWVEFAREHEAILASDECYGEFGWSAEPLSVLDPAICGGDHQGLLALHSLSKRSNLAGYRGGFIVGDSSVTTDLLALRKHAGMMVPGPIQSAMIAALEDQDHVEVQRARYQRRRDVMIPALESAGFTINHSQGSLYLWATRGENCRATIDWLAERGILAAPSDFYGTKVTDHVRIAMTATDERINAAAERLNP